MKLPRVAQLARALARSTPSAGADRYEPEVASKLDPVDGMHTAAGEGEQGSSPAPGMTFFTRLAAAFRGSKMRSAYRSPEEQQELERRAHEARRMNTTPVSSAVERWRDKPEVASGAMLAKTVDDPSGGGACSAARSLGPEAEVARGSNPAPGTDVVQPRTRPWIAWHQKLGDPECPYLIRWLFDPRLFSIRLHHWIRSDDKRAMHDHSWWFLTLVLSGGYTDWIYDSSRASESDHERICAANESVARVIKASRSAKFGGAWDKPPFFAAPPVPPGHNLNPQNMPYTEDRLTRGSIRFRPAHHIHTVAVDPGGCWTLVFTGRFVHKYGFYVRKPSGLLKFRKANKYFNQHGHHPCDQP